MPTRREVVERVAREQFGFERLRPGQLEAVEAVLDGRDTLAVLSTGSGKSAIYQLAGLLMDGPTLVVSPLIALQRDQVAALQERTRAGAASLNSTVPASERAAALAELAEDALEFLFLAPEQLANADVLAELAVARPSLLVVDEAHCISEWGHDFRPEYLRLGAVAEVLGRPTVLALTATAAPPVREEVIARLGLRDPAVVVRGFDRPNLTLAVERFHDEAPKLRALCERVAAAAGTGIVYTATRRSAEELAERLRDAGVAARAYHGGLRAAERAATQEAWMEGEARVVVATTAFGMGVDKPDVRFVVHAEPAESLDSYFQEIGRAGRDGQPAEALLLYRAEDVGIRRFFAGAGQVDLEGIARVAEAVHDHDGPVAPSELQEETDLSQSKLTAAVSRLEEAGAVAVLPTGDVVETDDSPPLRDAVEEAARGQANRRDFDRSRVEMMRGYAETDGCRRGYLLSYFGEPFEPPCGACDNCLAGLVTADGSGDAGMPFPVGTRVCHGDWGEGVVQRYDDGEVVVVLFDAVGYKTLAVALVVERELLVAA